jgi:hypothetical protein
VPDSIARVPPDGRERLRTGCRALATLALALPMACLAGRPVFEDLTLPALTARADWVVVATRVGAEETTTDTLGCPRQYWPLQVDRVLKAPSAAATASGSARLRVQVNVTGARDCRLRARQSAGASFPAARYNPSAPPPRAGETRVVFAIAGDGDMSLAAEQSWESIRRIDEIERLLPAPRPPGSTR